MKRKFLLASVVAAFVLFSRPPVQACTLWGAAGDAVAGGGSLIVKNRDWKPDHRQQLRVVKPEKGYAYLALTMVDRTLSGIAKGGINEKGFAVVNATASTIPAAKRNHLPATSRLNEKLLSQCASVDEALAKIDLFVGPRHLMLADKQKIAVVEIGPEGETSVRVQENGVLYHTNHYLDETLLYANARPNASSEARYKRIAELLAQARRPYTLDTFIGFSQDRHAGPDNSIFRIGSKPSGTRTVAVIAFSIPPSGSPEAYVRILNPGEKEKVYRLAVQDLLDGKIRLDS